jgi:hypothetical protein
VPHLPLRELVDQWRAEAQILQDNGASGQATVKLRDADELECALRQWGRERLTLDAAAKESGYSYSCLQKALRKGTIPNVGTKGRPRVRRGDLPRKPGLPHDTGPEPDVAGEILLRQHENLAGRKVV